MGKFWALAALIGSIVLFVGLIALAGKAASHHAWVSDGRPTFTEGEQLQIDHWRAGGLSLIAARRKVLAMRHSPFQKAMEMIHDTQSVMLDPAREDELRNFSPALAASILARNDNDPLKQTFIQSHLEVVGGEAASKLLEAIKRPELRVKITSLVSEQLRTQGVGVDSAVPMKQS